MNRRDLLKASVVIPAAGALTTCFGPLAVADTSCPPINFVSFRITLTGPFGIVVHLDPSDANKCTGITAFIPPDPGHQLVVNHDPPPNVSGPCDVTLQGDGLATYTAKPFISPAFNDFKENTSSFVLDPHFLQLTLPCPKSITTTAKIIPVQLSSGWKKMPLNHVFEYEIQDPSKKILLTGNSNFPDTCPLDSGDLFVDVGLPPGSDDNGVHAGCFFNSLIHDHFPHITDKVIAVDCTGLDKLNKKIAKAAQKMHKHTGAHKPAAHYPKGSDEDKGTDVECKNGGMLTLI